MEPGSALLTDFLALAGEVRLAWHSDGLPGSGNCGPGDSWRCDIVVAAPLIGIVGSHVDIATGPDGRPAVAYQRWDPLSASIAHSYDPPVSLWRTSRSSTRAPKPLLSRPSDEKPSASVLQSSAAGSPSSNHCRRLNNVRSQPDVDPQKAHPTKSPCGPSKPVPPGSDARNVRNRVGAVAVIISSSRRDAEAPRGPATSRSSHARADSRPSETRTSTSARSGKYTAASDPPSRASASRRVTPASE